MKEYRDVARFGAGMFIAFAVLLGVVFAAAESQEPDEQFDSPAVAVAIIDAQMELTRRQVVFYGFDQARDACATAAWRPAMHHAVRILEADPAYVDRVGEWVQAWGEGLIYCYRGDMGNAAAGIAEAYDLKDSMLATATSAVEGDSVR